MALTQRILNAQRSLARRVVDEVVAIGGMMLKVRARLVHGEWMRWVREAMPIELPTVRRYMMLATWADERPRDIARLKHLGPAKLYLLAPLTPGHRRKITGRAALAIPGGGRKTIDSMTVVELGRVIAGDLATPVPAPPIEKIVQALRHRVAGLDALAEELIKRKGEVDFADAEALHAAIVELGIELADAFGL